MADKNVKLKSSDGSTNLYPKTKLENIKDLPVTTTAGKVLKSTSTPNVLEWGDGGGGSSIPTIDLSGVTPVAENKIPITADQKATFISAENGQVNIKTSAGVITFGSYAEDGRLCTTPAEDTKPGTILAMKGYVTTEGSQSYLNISVSEISKTTYTAGANISISGNVISAVDTKYTAGTNIVISDTNVISATGGAGGNAVSVSATGTSTNVVNYITIDGVESKFPSGGSGVTIEILED